MKTRFAMVTVAAVLASSLACQRAKDNKQPIGIRDTVLHDTVRDVMGAPIPKPAEKIAPKPDVAETHRAEVLKATPAPVNPVVVPKKLKGQTMDEVTDPGKNWPYKGSR